jgi:hypothetical protein
MKYYESLMVMDVPFAERYKLRMRLESLVRDTFLGDSAVSDLKDEKNLVPDFSYLATQKDDKSTIVIVRSLIPIGLHTEKETRLTLAAGKKMLLKFSCCTETNFATTSGRRCWQGDELIECMAMPRLKNAGFDVEDIKIRGFERLNMNKNNNSSSNSNWYLQGALIDAQVVVKEPDLAEKSLILGVSKKRSFGFGFVRFSDLV